MTRESETEYYRRREAITRALANGAKNPAIAQIHRQMADSYADLVRASDPRSTVATDR